MARMAHPDSMQPSRPGPTRTAPGRMPDKFPAAGRYASYTAFGATSFFSLAISLLVLRMTWALGEGPEAWTAVIEGFRNPIYVVFHVVALGVFLFVAHRFLINLSPGAQPPKVGPLRPPPAPLIPFVMGALWVGATAAALAVLWGVVL